jgi:hypothetical protein
MASIGPLLGRAADAVKRAWPVVLEGYRRWDQLPQHKKDQYRQQVLDAVDRGRAAVQKRRKR